MEWSSNSPGSHRLNDWSRGWCCKAVGNRFASPIRSHNSLCRAADGRVRYCGNEVRGRMVGGNGTDSSPISPIRGMA